VTETTKLIMRSSVFLLALSILQISDATKESMQARRDKIRVDQLQLSAPRNFYFDLGANNGDSIISFLDKITANIPTVNTNTATDGSVNSKVFAPAPQGTNFSAPWWIIAVEPNKKYLNELGEKKKLLEKRSNIKSVNILLKTAVTTFDGEIEFISDAENKDDVGNAGASIMSDSKSAVGIHYKVQAMDIVTLLLKKNVIRKIDFVVIKLVCIIYSYIFIIFCYLLIFPPVICAYLYSIIGYRRS
jgi:hypothetical protein